MAITGFPMANTGGNAANVGDLSQLPTNDKTSVVNAIIELNGEITASSSILHLQDIVLTPTDNTNHHVNLDFIPASNSVELWVIGGILQKENIDFMVTGQQLSWENLALELLVSEGSILHLSYIRG